MIGERLREIQGRIAAAARRVGRDPAAIHLLAVSKTKPAELVREALAKGQPLFGENYIQEAEEKIAASGAGPRWHFIGHLQGNKARRAVELFDCVETVDRLKIALRLNEHAGALGKRLEVLLQVNVSGEAQKSGVSPELAAKLAARVGELPHLCLAGLMTMPPYADDPEESRPFFRAMRELAKDLRTRGLLGCGGEAVQLSMGMSADFEVAIEEGATIVRVGSLLFGQR